VVDVLPLFLAHLRMGGANVFDIVSDEVRVHSNAVLPERLVILRAGQRRQTEELEKVDRQFFLSAFPSIAKYSGHRSTSHLCQGRTWALLFNYFVGTREHCGSNFEAERLGGGRRIVLSGMLARVLQR
jgi:hypothetical protein